MSDEMRELAARAQRLNNAGGAGGSNTVEVARYRFWFHALNAARAGTLTPNWRDTLTVDVLYEMTGSPGGRPPAAAVSIGQCDAEDLALYEVVTSPVADWEPYAAGGDWRRALDAWYHESIRRLDAYEAAQNRHWAELREGMSAQMLRLHPATTVMGAALRKPSPIDEFMSTFQRDRLGALYRAGLAAGGETNDWIGWYRNRAAQWDVTGDAQKHAGMKQAILTDLTEPQSITEQRAAMEKLPDYWKNAYRHT
ncbi:hypothetical protein [Mycolicibacterium goodii]|uniref:hypothetical protein n=1 Tax=Mycolicibacterium goodii TaxID=134601 RepID=UPI001BDC1CDD|nr:hypothetical protein [Mycolicibacterium goodii]MBU8834476.1 hypothetical protein [Mycolicibacterium goodii]